MPKQAHPAHPRDTDHHLVAKSNDLIRASYKLTLNEQRLILLAVAGLHSTRPGIRPGFNQVDAIRITAHEFAEAWRLPIGKAYAALREAASALYERTIVKIGGKRTEKMRWIGRQAYHDGEGWVEISFWPEITPHLTGLSGCFTKYRLGQVANLRSTYAVRIFEWCVQFMDTGWMVISLEELAERLGVAYTRFVDIRRFVIDPAIKELTAKSNLEIAWQPVKEGRAVTAIRFEFQEKAQKSLDLYGEPGDESPPVAGEMGAAPRQKPSNRRPA